MPDKKLTPEDERIIVEKGTEAPFSGKYDDFFEAGMYTCKRCGAQLYKSENKFDAGCGWLAFDGEIPGAVILPFSHLIYLSKFMGPVYHIF